MSPEGKRGTMSRAAKLTLAASGLFAITTVIVVHFQQKAEKSVLIPLSPSPLLPTNYSLQAMHAGVIRDMDQQRIKRERQLDFEMQRDLEKEYKKVQNVRDGAIGDKPQ